MGCRSSNPRRALPADRQTPRQAHSLVAVARAIPVIIIWRLLPDADTRFHDLGSLYHTNRIDTTLGIGQPHQANQHKK
jgi:hypothetical protein